VSTALEVASTVVDPELPQLTLADLGVLREVRDEDGRLVVTITPTYTGCPAVAEMRADLTQALHAAGYADVDVRLALEPAWSTDDITAEGRAKLVAAGISPPGAAPHRNGPVPLTLTRRAPVGCPQCGSSATEETSHFGPTPCTALWRCTSCGEPFEHVKEI
jgi:ring-1,2-phenylacetyl-CoA epoxidase subunit PaaD